MSGFFSYKIRVKKNKISFFIFFKESPLTELKICLMSFLLFTTNTDFFVTTCE